MTTANLTGSPPILARGALPRPGTGLAPARRNLGLFLVAAGLPALTAVLVNLPDRPALASLLLLYLLAVVVVAVVGGVLPAVLAAGVSFGLANWFLTPPYHTLAVASRDSVIELVVFLLVALAVSVTVDLGARRRVAAARSGVQAELLSRFTGEPVAHVSPEEVLDQVRALFGMTCVAVVEDGTAGASHEVARVGTTSTEGRTTEDPTVTVPAGPDLRLLCWGPAPFTEDGRLLASLAQAAGRAVEGRRLADEAARARELAEVDRLRSALLAAVGHELRTPLAGAKAAVSTLRQRDVAWTPAEQEELLATIEESTDHLAHLVANLLDLSRLNAGALSVRLAPVALDEVVAAALLGNADREVEHLVPDDLPLVLADAGLLERVVANLVDNAVRFSPPGAPVRVSAALTGAGAVTLQVADRGPGVPEDRWDRMFVPFQRLGDRCADGGLGLGLAIARGFTEAMQGSLTPSRTPGGGLTMTVTLPVAP